MTHPLFLSHFQAGRASVLVPSSSVLRFDLLQIRSLKHVCGRAGRAAPAAREVKASSFLLTPLASSQSVGAPPLSPRGACARLWVRPGVCWKPHSAGGWGTGEGVACFWRTSELGSGGRVRSCAGESGLLAFALKNLKSAMYRNRAFHA